MRIAVLGSGNGGCAIAFDCAASGLSVGGQTYAFIHETIGVYRGRIGAADIIALYVL